MALAIVNFPRPVLDAIYLAERPDAEKIKILALIVTRDVLLAGRVKLDCLEGGTHEEMLRPQVNPMVECLRDRKSVG